MNHQIPESDATRFTYSTSASTASLATTTSFHSALQDDQDHTGSFQFNPLQIQLKRQGTWNSLGASTIRASTQQQRQQSVISNTSSYYSSITEYNSPTTNNAPDLTTHNVHSLASPVVFRKRTLENAPSEDSLRSKFDFNEYASPGPSATSVSSSFPSTSPASLQSESTAEDREDCDDRPYAYAYANSTVATPNSANGPNSSTFDAFHILTSHELDHLESEPNQLSRAFSSLPLDDDDRDVNSGRGSSIFGFDSGDNAVASKHNSSQYTLPLKTTQLSYDSEVYDTSYESTTPKHTPYRKVSSLLPPNIQHVDRSITPPVVPRELSFPSIFGSTGTDSSESRLSSGTSGAFRISSGRFADINSLSDEASVTNLNSNTQQATSTHHHHASQGSTRQINQITQSEYLPYIVHPTRPSMPHVYRMRDVDLETHEQSVGERQFGPSSPLTTQMSSRNSNFVNNPVNNTNPAAAAAAALNSAVYNTSTSANKDHGTRERVSNLAMIPMYASPNIDSLSKFPFKNSQMPERVVETALRSPKRLGASANITQKFDEKHDFNSASAIDSGSRFDPSRVHRFETSPYSAHPLNFTVSTQPELNPSNSLQHKQKPSGPSANNSMTSSNYSSHNVDMMINNNNNSLNSGMSYDGRNNKGMNKSTPLPNLFSTRSSTRHMSVSSGMLPPVARRNTTRPGRIPTTTVPVTTISKGKKSYSISSISSLLSNKNNNNNIYSPHSQQQHHRVPFNTMRQKNSEPSLRDIRDGDGPSDSSSLYADAVSQSATSQALREQQLQEQQQQPSPPPVPTASRAPPSLPQQPPSTLFGPLHGDGSSVALPATLPIVLPRTAPNPPEIFQVTNPNDPRIQPQQQQPQPPPQAAHTTQQLSPRKLRRQESEFAARVKRSGQQHQSVADDDDALNATAAAARAISNEDWEARNGNTQHSKSHYHHHHTKTSSHGAAPSAGGVGLGGISNEKVSTFTDEDGNPVCNPTAETFLLCVFVIFPPLWLLMGAGFFDGLFGKVSTRSKMIAFVLSGAFFLMAIAGLVVGIVVGIPD